MRRATGKMFKAVKRHRRVTKRDLIAEADRAVIAQTATAAPDRIDDETRGNKLAPSATGEVAGHLIRSRPCYICKQHYTQVDAFYHQLCPECAAVQPQQARRPHRPDRPPGPADRRPGQDRHVHRAPAAPRRRAHHHHHPLPQGRRPPLRRHGGQRATGCTGCGSWASTCAIPSQVMALTDSLDAAGPLDIIINNAAQTVRRSGNAYKPLVDAEDEPLPGRPRGGQRRSRAGHLRPCP